MLRNFLIYRKLHLCYLLQPSKIFLEDTLHSNRFIMKYNLLLADLIVKESQNAAASKTTKGSAKSEKNSRKSFWKAVLAFMLRNQSATMYRVS